MAREVEVLAGIPLFAGLDRSKLKFLAFTSERVTYNAGQNIFCQGEVGDNAYIIVEGEVEVVLATPDGEKVIGHIGKNELFGELALLIDSPRTATIRTRAKLTVLTISKELFVGLINEDAAISSNVVRAIARRFEGTMSEYSRAKVMYDSATQLPTMSLFFDRYQQSVTQFKRVKRQAALVIFKFDVPELAQADLDSEVYQTSFKEIVERISTCVRETDTLGHLDNMEFGVIMNEVDDNNAPSFLVNRIASAMLAPLLVGSEAVSVKPPINFKVRLCESDDLGVTVEEILDLVRTKGEDFTVGS
jgi:CRP-like cAMP-binding protein